MSSAARRMLPVRPTASNARTIVNGGNRWIATLSTCLLRDVMSAHPSSLPTLQPRR
jgi:hypothetical protein